MADSTVGTSGVRKPPWPFSVLQRRYGPSAVGLAPPVGGLHPIAGTQVPLAPAPTEHYEPANHHLLALAMRDGKRKRSR